MPNSLPHALYYYNYIYIYIYRIIRVKLWFTTMCFVGFNSVPNLIVILFNLLYPVFIMGFYCKGCVIERVCVKTQAIEDWRVFVGISWLSIPQSDSCDLHILECEKSRQDEDILFCQTVNSNTHFLCLHYLYTYYPQMLRSASERKP